MTRGGRRAEAGKTGPEPKSGGRGGGGGINLASVAAPTSPSGSQRLRQLQNDVAAIVPAPPPPNAAEPNAAAGSEEEGASAATGGSAAGGGASGALFGAPQLLWRGRLYDVKWCGSTSAGDHPSTSPASAAWPIPTSGLIFKAADDRVGGEVTLSNGVRFENPLMDELVSYAPPGSNSNGSSSIGSSQGGGGFTIVPSTTPKELLRFNGRWLVGTHHGRGNTQETIKISAAPTIH